MRTKVLIVDDHQMFRDGLRLAIEQLDGFVVAGDAGNGRQALRLVKQLEPDIVLIDVSMPDLNGVEATAQIRAVSADLKILALSMHTEGSYVRRMLRAGANGYVVKSAAAEELFGAMDAAMNGGVYLSPAVAGVVVEEMLNPRSAGDGSVLERLSTREKEVMQLLVEGRSVNDISTTIHLSAKTVHAHRQKILEKLQVDNIAALTKLAIREGLTTLDC